LQTGKTFNQVFVKIVFIVVRVVQLKKENIACDTEWGGMSSMKSLRVKDGQSRGGRVPHRLLFVYTLLVPSGQVLDSAGIIEQSTSLASFACHASSPSHVRELFKLLNVAAAVRFERF